MPNSKSLKADKELMWKKLSTVQKPTDLAAWEDMLANNLRGWKKGEMTIIACGRQTGKSTVWKEIRKEMWKETAIQVNERKIQNGIQKQADALTAEIIAERFK